MWKNLFFFLCYRMELRRPSCYNLLNSVKGKLLIIFFIAYPPFRYHLVVFKVKLCYRFSFDVCMQLWCYIIMCVSHHAPQPFNAFGWVVIFFSLLLLLRNTIFRVDLSALSPSSCSLLLVFAHSSTGFLRMHTMPVHVCVFFFHRRDIQCATTRPRVGKRRQQHISWLVWWWWWFLCAARFTCSPCPYRGGEGGYRRLGTLERTTTML